MLVINECVTTFMKLLRAGFISFKKERILIRVKPEKKPKKIKKQHKESRGEMGQGIVGDAELFLWGAGLI